MREAGVEILRRPSFISVLLKIVGEKMWSHSDSSVILTEDPLSCYQAITICKNKL